MWRPLLLHLLDLATVVATTSQCLEWWGELRRYLLQSSLREQSVSDVSDDPLSSSTFFDPLLRTGARELKGMKWRRIRRRGVTDEVFTFVLGNGPSHFLAWVQVPHWRGQRKKKSASLGRVKGLLLGLLRLPIFFLFDLVFCLPPPPPTTTEPGPRLLNFFFRFLFSVGVLLSVPSSRNLSCTVLYLHPFRVGVGFTAAAKLAFCGLRLSVPTSYVAPTLAGGGAARLLEHKKQTS